MHSSRGHRLALLRTLLLAAAAGCASTPPAPVQAPDELLAEAEARFTAEQPDAALTIVESWDRTTVPARLTPRYDLVHARALFALDRGFDAFEVLRDFYRDSPRSDLRPAAVELQWRIGNYLVHTGRAFWIFWSDRRAGKTVLEHLVTNHPDSTELADALKTLGDLAYEDRDFTMAQERFRELLRWRPESEWVIYARFRFAMSLVESLQGPDYDLDRMEHAERELREFLAANPENPDFVAASTRSLDLIREWQATRHLQIAHFYRTVDNPPGYQLHLQIASDERYAGTAANSQARAELGLPKATTEPGR
ncbi:MAG: outer membrane protein assembly factor BamD [Planctomycetes bacterium]|nr:outer membrane protein assembly factor BamD [Planctomycetota bacterium]